MNDLTTRSPPPFNGSALRIELAKMLGLVAPITMSADQCTLWLASAEDALLDIRPAEVAEVSMEVRRTVTRPSQIVPEIAKLVAENRARASRIREASQPLIEGPPPKRHITDRDRRYFKAADWAELTEYLERTGATGRYRSDGTIYHVTPAEAREARSSARIEAFGRDRGTGLDAQHESRISANETPNYPTISSS